MDSLTWSHKVNRLFWELWIGLNFNKLLCVALAVRGNKQYSFESVHLPQQTAVDYVRAEIRSLLHQLDGYCSTLKKMLQSCLR